MTKTEQLDELFEKWQKKQKEESDESLIKTMIESPIITKEFFCKDGIICEEQFDKETVKVLFIASEPNIDNEEGRSIIESGGTVEAVTSQSESFEKYHKTGIEDFGGGLKRNICKHYMWMFSLTENEEKRHIVANRFAFLNLNKRGGGKEADNMKIASYCKAYKDEIIEEIRIINPDVIVWLGTGTFDEVFYNKIFDFVDKETHEGEKKYYLSVGTRNIPVLREYHPSYHYKTDENKRLHIQKGFNTFKDELITNESK